MAVSATAKPAEQVGGLIHLRADLRCARKGRPPQLEEIEKSQTWTQRLRMMNRVKSYYTKNGLNSLDFGGLSKKKVDDELRNILRRIDVARSKG